MVRLALNSLKRVLLAHEMAFLLLVVVTGTMAGTSAFFWHQTSQDSLRLARMTLAAQQVRSDLFRQIKEVYLVRILEDAEALTVYSDYSRAIDRRFNELRRSARGTEELEAVQALQQTYRVVQKDMNNIFADPYFVARVVQVQILDPVQERNLVADFEAAFGSLQSLLETRQDEMEATIDRWTGIAPFVVSVPILAAVVLLVASRRIFQRSVVRPMECIIAGARRIREDDLGQAIDVGGVQETKDLANAINTMASDLAASRDALVEQERQAVLGSLVPVVAHNIRNPLATIRANAQLLDDAEPEEILEIRSGVIETVDRLGRWVSSLVSYLHPLTPQPQRRVMVELLDSVVGLLGPKIEEKQVTVQRVGWDKELEVEVDADLMEQALFGLLTNAVEASPDGGTVKLSVIAELRDLQVHIEDEGGGMPFKPEPSGLTPGPTTKRFGTGLGIPVAFKVCRAHGWTLNFTTRSDGGTRVSIVAPRQHRRPALRAGGLMHG